MPRVFDKVRRPTPTETRLERKKTRRTRGFLTWQDPYPQVIGTFPEKQVYAALMRIGIGFKFQHWFNAKISEVSFDKWYRPDFVIPSLKVIIEVQGFYFHSQPKQIEKDAFKYAIYTHLGYKVLTWWDTDINRNVWELISAVPGLNNYQGKTIGEIITKDKEIRDDSAGIRKANTARTDYGLHVVKRKTYKGRKKPKAYPLSSYNVQY